MKFRFLIVATVLVFSGGIATYLFWQQIRPPSAPVQLLAPPSAPPAVLPEVRNVVEAPPSQPPLPALADSDKLLLDALAGLVGNKSLMGLFHADRFIRNFVATIDNLPGRRAPMGVLPVVPAPGAFAASSATGSLTISPGNAARYSAYVKIAEAIDAKKLVGLYVRLYPLFQQAYEALGYPNKYFNDRLVVALDDLLAAPIATAPVQLVQPNVYYRYADPGLESRSIGQRILMRLGSKNEDLVKARLREIKEELLRHLHQEKVVQPG
ncbi:MAG: DUF3014 domain-containing protein [Gallionella sp.]